MNDDRCDTCPLLICDPLNRLCIQTPEFRLELMRTIKAKEDRIERRQEQQRRYAKNDYHKFKAARQERARQYRQTHLEEWNEYQRRYTQTPERRAKRNERRRLKMETAKQEKANQACQISTIQN